MEYATFVHSNFGLGLGLLKYVVAMPLFHHWHQGSETGLAPLPTWPVFSVVRVHSSS